MKAGSGAAAPIWSISYSPRVLEEDLPDVGHAAFRIARKAINKKLKIAPESYGENLHHPLHGFRKLKSSHIRIVYRVDVEAMRVLVLMIGDRKEIWDTDQSEILSRYETSPEREAPLIKSKPPGPRR